MKTASYNNVCPRAKSPAACVSWITGGARQLSRMLAAGLLFTTSAAASISYNQNITAIFGTGNPNGGWTVDTIDNIQLGLRAKDRSSGATPNNGAGAYSFAPSLGPRATFNYEFSINSDIAGVQKLTQYDFYLMADSDPSLGINFAVVAPLTHWGDNSYGINTTANGAGVEGAAATLAADNNIAQNSQNITFWDYPGGGLLLETNATYTYELFAVASGTGPAGNRLASVRITVVVGAGGASATGPVVSDVQPLIVPVNTPFLVTANVTGGSSIVSASYRIDGLPVSSMEPVDGSFGGLIEPVKATFGPGLPVGVYRLSVNAQDAAGKLNGASTLLAVYDPSAGFVTGGGWIDSPAGAYRGPNAWQTKWDQSFATDTSGWFDNDDYAGFGNITSLGNGTARVEGVSGGPFSRFDGYNSIWPGTWIAEIDVYLDPAALAAGDGFDYSVAASGSDGNHQRDYIFHVTKDTSTGKLFVAGSNNSNPGPREDLENINHYEITAAGWYTLQHRFYDAGGYLAVDLNLVNSAGQIVFTETRANVADTIPGDVGGNRYGWFTFVAIPGGLLVDNHQRFEYLGVAGKANFGFLSKYQKGATVPSGTTEFVFSAGGLNFHSGSYDWLVVNQNGTNAQFKGIGTINGGGSYGFMLWATDGASTASADTFRIHIWDESNGGTTIYDNGVDQHISGGNILVHTPKK